MVLRLPAPHPGVPARRALPWLLLAALLQAALLRPAPAAQPPRQATEDELQALFVLNFARLTEWPAALFDSPATPLVLCVDGARAPLLAALRRSGIDTVQGRPLRLRELARGEAAPGCHLLFLDGLDLRRAGAGQLSVGDAAGFAAAGGVIALVRVGNRLRFEVNHEAAQRAQLRLGSELLKLALPPGGGAAPAAGSAP